MELPTIQSYGKYASTNYGAHCLSMQFPSGFRIYYSYETVIAFRGDNGLKVRENSWSTTTGKHLNWIDGGDKKGRIPSEQFESELHDELVKHNLS